MILIFERVSIGEREVGGSRQCVNKVKKKKRGGGDNGDVDDCQYLNLGDVWDTLASSSTISSSSSTDERIVGECTVLEHVDSRHDHLEEENGH